jgi:hypothetical protein
MARSVLSSVLLLSLLLLGSASAHAVLCYDTAEIVLNSTTSYNAATGTPNPFDLSLVAQVTAPSGRRYPVTGFFDGNGAGGAIGNVFKVRVFADELGTWRWAVSSTNVPGLAGRSGTFAVSGKIAGTFARGPVVENPSYPRSFMFRNGEPVFLTAKFLDNAAPSPIKYSHTLLSEKLTDTNRQAMLNRHIGMKLNKMNVYYANRGDYASMSTTPWVGTAASNNKTRFDLARWRMYDQWIVKLRDAGMVAHLWFFADDSGFGDLPDADRQRLIKYAMARHSAYVHTMYILALEWQEGWTTTEVHNHANFLQQNNPWARLVSVHGVTGDFSFPSAAWADYMDIQAGNEVSHSTVYSRGVKNRGLAAKPLIQEEHGLGDENTINRQRAWAGFMSGAASVGSGAFLTHLAKFANLVDYERMAPASSVVSSSNAYALAEPNRAYVLYAYNGGRIGVNLSGVTGTFIAEWYDPRTGAFQAATAATGGGVRYYQTPTAADWVLYLHK